MEYEAVMIPIRAFRKGFISLLGVLFLLGLSTAPKSTQQPLNGIDLKMPQEISGNSLDIERFVGTLVIKTKEDLNNLILSAMGNDNELKELTVLTDEEGEGEVN